MGTFAWTIVSVAIVLWCGPRRTNIHHSQLPTAWGDPLNSKSCATLALLRKVAYYFVISLQWISAKISRRHLYIALPWLSNLLKQLLVFERRWDTIMSFRSVGPPCLHNIWPIHGWHRDYKLASVKRIKRVTNSRRGRAKPAVVAITCAKKKHEKEAKKKYVGGWRNSERVGRAD